MNLCVGVHLHLLPNTDKHGAAGTHHGEPEKNQTSDISIVQAERKGCTAVITFGGEGGNTVRGCLGYLIACALICVRMHIWVHALPSNPLTRTCISLCLINSLTPMAVSRLSFSSQKSHKALGLHKALITQLLALLLKLIHL